MARVIWHGDAVLKAFKSKAARQVRAAAIFLMMDIQRDLGRTQGPPGAAEGETPHWRTRQLHDSMTWEVVGTRGRVGPDHTNKYGVYLELGTSLPNGAPRPFLRPGLARNRARLLKMMSKQ